MTDNEIITALECCSNGYMCDKCPYYKDGCSSYDANMSKDVLNCINRLKSEIEQLTEEVDALNGNTEKYIVECERRSREITEDYRKEIESEAIREFAEQLKENVTYYEDECGEFVPWVDCRDIDILVAENTEVDDV